MQKYAVTIITAVLLGVSTMMPKYVSAYINLNAFVQTYNLAFDTYAPYVSVNTTQPKASTPIAAKVTQPKPQYKNTPTYVTESRLLIELNKLKAELIQPTSPIFISSQSDRLADSLSRNFTAQVNTVTSDSVAKGGDAALGTLTVNQLVSNGNVGVGTSTPTYPLSVTNNSSSSTVLASFANGYSTTAVGNASKLTLSVYNSGIGNAASVGIGAVTDSITAGQRGSALVFYYGNQATGLTEGMRLTGATVGGNSAQAGRLGLGTSTPTSRMHVVDNSGNLNNVILQTDVANNGSSVLELRTNNGSGRYLIRGYGNYDTTRNQAFALTAGGSMGINNFNPASPLDVVNNGSPNIFALSSATTSIGNLMTVTSAGNVGIGTTTPSARLAIHGSTDAIQSIVRGNTTQTSELAQWQNGTGVPVVRFTNTGHIALNLAPIVADTILNVTGGNNERVDTTVTAKGMDMRVINALSGNINNITAVSESRYVGSISSVVGVQSAIVSNAVSGNVIIDGKGFYALAPTLNAGGLLTNVYGFYAAGQKISGVTNAYGFYSAGASDINYFAGNVGIGTTTPQGKLHVQSVNNDAIDDFVLSDSQSIKKFAISLDGANGDNYAQLRLYNNNNSVYSTIHTQSGRLSLSGPSGSNGIGLQNSLFVTDTGNVGIGTTTPSTKLHISPSAWGEYIRFGYNSSVINAGIGIDSNGSYGLTLFSRGATIAKFEDQSGGLAIGTTYSQSATIPDGGAIFEGNVGIGTTSPARKLSVASDGTYSAYFVGRVGIGIQTPSYPLHVQGNTAIEGGMYLGATNLSGLLDVHRYCSGEGEVGGGCASDSGIVLRNAANGGNIPTSILFKPGQGDTSVAQIKALYNSVSANTSRLSFLVRDTGGSLVDRLRITESGKIGFSTTTPNNMLDIYSTSKAAIGFSGASGGTYKWTMGMDVTNGGRFAIASSSALGANDIFVISGAGNVGIGTTTPGQKLTVVGNAQFTAVTSGTYGSDLNLTSTGVLTTAASDIRLKENLEALNASSTLDKILQLKPYTFTWINDPTHQKDIGLIAQDVAGVFPEITFTNKSDGFMGINYSRIPALLISAVQEINQMIVGLAEKVTTKLVEAVKGVFVDVEAQKVKTQQLCIGETCITEAELKEFLNSRDTGGVSQSAPVVIPESPVVNGSTSPASVDVVNEIPPATEVTAPVDMPAVIEDTPIVQAPVVEVEVPAAVSVPVESASTE